MRPKYENRAVRVADLVVTTDEVADTDFINCQIIGPAIINFSGCTLNYAVFVGTPDAILWEIEESRPVQGVVFFQNCLFDGCRFERIGVIGSADQLAPIRSLPWGPA